MFSDANKDDLKKDHSGIFAEMLVGHFKQFDLSADDIVGFWKVSTIR